MSDFTVKNPVAYFCAEFGLQAKYPLYAGGLGVLAGDTLKAAADMGFPVVGVGLLYRGDASIQVIDETGMQREEDMKFDPFEAGLEHLYIDDQPVFIRVHLTTLDVWLRCWKKTLSNKVTLYLLDADTDQNEIVERSITHVLYGGEEDTKIKQQMLLGIGGVKLLHTLGIHPELYHVQEGRPALLQWQLTRSYMEDHGKPFKEARLMAQQKTVYTNHTLVAAGIGKSNSELLKLYGEYYADKMEVSIDELTSLGDEPDGSGFSFTRLALNTSKKASGVSQLHTQLSQRLWPQYTWTNVTNGVHLPTWQSQQIKDAQQDDQRLWQAHNQEKKNLAEFALARTGYSYDPNRLVIAWARRFAGYKRYTALFEDINRLISILRNSQRPVQLLMAGKAHKLDTVGKRKLQQIIRYFARELNGYALFIPNYDLDVAQAMVRGADIWLNTPRKGKEACGTSGMKAISNGVLQCTVRDGWSAEVDWQGLGWELEDENISESLYQTLEEKIVPLFYDRDGQGIPREWVQMMKGSIQLAEKYSAKRMMQEYIEKLYS